VWFVKVVFVNSTSTNVNIDGLKCNQSECKRIDAIELICKKDEWAKVQFELCSLASLLLYRTHLNVVCYEIHEWGIDETQPLLIYYIEWIEFSESL